MKNFLEYYLRITDKKSLVVIESDSFSSHLKLGKWLKRLYTINNGDFDYYIITTIKGERNRIYAKTRVEIHFNRNGTISIYDSANRPIIQNI